MPTSRRKKAGWMLLLWAASVLTLGLVSLGFRLLMAAAGFRS